MSNAHQLAGTRSTLRKTTFKRQLGLRDLVQALFFALAFAFTAAVVLGVFH